MLFPAWTGTGLAMLVTDRSAESATKTLAAAVLLAQVGSLAEQDTESVWVMVDPEATFALTCTTNVKFAGVAPVGPRLAIVQVRVPRVHVQVPGPLRETAVVLAGRVSVKVTAVAAAGPPLATVCV